MTDTSKTKLHLGKNGWAVCKAEQRACPYGGSESHIEVTGASKEALQFLNDMGISAVAEKPTSPSTALDVDPDTVSDIVKRVMGYMNETKRRELVEAIGEYTHAPGYNYADRYHLVEASLVGSSEDSAFRPAYSRDAARMIFIAGGVATSEDRNGKLNFYNLNEPNPVYEDTPAEDIGPGDLIALRSHTVDGVYTKVHAEVLKNGALPTQEFGRSRLVLQTAFSDTDPRSRRDPINTTSERAEGVWSVRQPTESSVSGS
jgi:hypothetical protein